MEYVSHFRLYGVLMIGILSGVDFVSKSIKVRPMTAIKIDYAAERCVNVLLNFIEPEAVMSSRRPPLR
jgi:hypothetical protein